MEINKFKVNRNLPNNLFTIFYRTSMADQNTGSHIVHLTDCVSSKGQTHAVSLEE